MGRKNKPGSKNQKVNNMPAAPEERPVFREPQKSWDEVSRWFDENRQTHQPEPADVPPRDRVFTSDFETERNGAPNRVRKTNGSGIKHASESDGNNKKKPVRERPEQKKYTSPVENYDAYEEEDKTFNSYRYSNNGGMEKAGVRHEKMSEKEYEKHKEYYNKNRDSGKSKDELRREFAAKNKQKRNRKIVRGVVIGVSLVVVALFLVSYFFLLKVQTIEVRGDTRYSQQEIITASGIEVGDKLMNITSDGMSQRLSEKLPYVGNVTVRWAFPTGVKLIIKETTPAFALRNGKKYLLTDENLKILELESDKSEKAIILIGIQAVNAEPGQKLQCEKEEPLQTAFEILECAESYGLNIVRISVSDENDIRALTKKGVRLEFGSKTELENKMSIAKESIRKMKNENSLNEGVLNLKINGKAYFHDGESNLKAEPTTIAYVTQNTESDSTTEKVTGEDTTAPSTQDSTESETTAESSTEETTVEGTIGTTTEQISESAAQ